jgi:hypothetical protein
MTNVDLGGKWWLGGRDVKGMTRVAATVPTICSGRGALQTNPDWTNL